MFEGLPRVAGKAEISADTLEVIKRGMLKATSPGGTAGAVFAGSAVQVAGKTGTVEMDPRLGADDHGWFVGYAPAHDPEIAIAVIIEQGGGGARSAAPVVRRLFDYFFGSRTEGSTGRNSQ